MTPTSYRQVDGEVRIAVDVDGDIRDVVVDRENLTTLLQVTLCAIVKRDDDSLTDADEREALRRVAHKITRAWLP